MRLCIRTLLISCLLVFFGAVSVVSAQSVVQSYSVSSPIKIGMIVELAGKNSVKPLTKSDATQMFGVAINPNASPVTLSSGSSDQAFVATGGTYEVLVTNQAGAIKPNDYVTISSLSGFGMKAGSEDSTVIGKAVSGFYGTSDSLGTDKLKDSLGRTSTVQLGLVETSIAVGRNPAYKPPASNVPGLLQHAAGSIASKPVNSARAYLSLLVLLISAIIAGSMLYAGVRSSIIAIGRNPLSKRSIIRSLIQAIVASLIIFIIGVFAVYLILRF